MYVKNILILDYYHKNIMVHSKTSFEYPKIETTRTMKEKAQLFGRCLINIMKFWLVCFTKKPIKDKQTDKNTNASSA